MSIWTCLSGGGRWVSIAINQTVQTNDLLLIDELLGNAGQRVDRRVIVLASGGLSHQFFPFKELRNRKSSDPSNVISPEARAADEHVLELLRERGHAQVTDEMPWYKKRAPEGKARHHLITVGAIGVAMCVAKGQRFSDYEASVGTGQVHVWFERPAEGGRPDGVGKEGGSPWEPIRTNWTTSDWVRRGSR